MIPLRLALVVLLATAHLAGAGDSGGGAKPNGTLPALLKSAGYRTAVLGKWHLGFGRGAEPDYNAELNPGPLEIGFDSFFGCPRRGYICCSCHNVQAGTPVENTVAMIDAAQAFPVAPHL